MHIILFLRVLEKKGQKKNYEYRVRTTFLIPVFFIFLVYVFFAFVNLLLVRLVDNPEVSFTEAGWFFVLKALLSFIFVIYAVLRWYNHVCVITPKQIVLRKGVIRKYESVFLVKNIESLKLDVSLFGRLFGYGSLCMYSPTLNEKVRVSYLMNPKKYMDLIHKSLPTTTADKIVPGV